jgi:hypothetical protein
LLNFLRLPGYNTSIAVSKPSAAILRRILLLCARRITHKTSGAETAAAAIIISTVFIILQFCLNSYTKIVPVQLVKNSFCAV